MYDHKVENFNITKSKNLLSQSRKIYHHKVEKLSHHIAMTGILYD